MVHILPGRPAGKPDQMSPIRAAVPSPPTARSMSTLGLDTIRVPLASNTPPYSIDEFGEHDCYVRIRRPGPDLIALVPPGDCATGFRTRLISELQAHASRQIATRRLDGLLIALLFVAIPLLLVSACIAAAAGVTPFPAGSVLARSTPIVMLALLLGYVVEIGRAQVCTSVTCPFRNLFSLL